MAQSLYALISEAVVDGHLPDGFSLPHEPRSSGLSWADGALDGVGIFHWGHGSITDEQKELMTNAVTEAANGNTSKADELFFKLGQLTRALSAIDELQQYVIDNRDHIPAQTLFEYALHLSTETADTESVKFGLSLLELFNTAGSKPVRKIVQTLGLSDEFTLFASFVIGQWPDANEELFSLAQRVHGWGRIHLIERIEPETPEIRTWLLRDGVHNDVMAAYSALECWNKSDAREVLKGEMSREDFSGVRDIIEGLLDEGPVSGISEIKDGPAIILTFLRQAQTRSLDINDYETIRIIRIHYEDEDENNPEIINLCNAIIQTDECRSQVMEAVNSGRALALADELNIEYDEAILNLLRTDFDKGSFLCRTIMDDKDTRTQVLQIFREKLPFDKMKAVPSDTAGIGPEFKGVNQLEALVAELGRFPLEGADLVAAILQTAPIRARGQGVAVLRSWVETKQEPLQTLLPDVHETLCKVYKIETDDELKANMESLINGEMMFSHAE